MQHLVFEILQGVKWIHTIYQDVYCTKFLLLTQNTATNKLNQTRHTINDQTHVKYSSTLNLSLIWT